MLFYVKEVLQGRDEHLDQMPEPELHSNRNRIKLLPNKLFDLVFGYFSLGFPNNCLIGSKGTRTRNCKVRFVSLNFLFDRSNTQNMHSHPIEDSGGVGEGYGKI